MNIKKFPILIALTIAITSCSDFLDRFPLDKISSEAYYTSEGQVNTALTGCYRRLMYTGWDGNIDHSLAVLSGNCIFDCFADNGYIKWGFLGITSGNLNAANAAVSGMYQYPYEGIAICNDFIANVETKCGFLSEAKKNQYIAEAKFIRAYQYFGLTNLYGDVVLTLKIEDADFIAPRSPKKEVVKAILDDLDYGIANLPNEAYTDGKIKKGAAYALKMRVLLYEKDYAGVVKIWNDYFATGENKFSIASDYDDIFKGSNQAKCPEIILSAIYVQDVKYRSDIEVTLTAYTDAVALPNFMNEFEFNDGTPYSKSNPKFDSADPFNNRDPRLTKILFDTVQIKEKDNLYYGKLNMGAIPTGKLIIKKFSLVENLPAVWTDTKQEQDAVLLRFADVALMYAEAENELNGPSDKVVNAVQLVRGRQGVNMPKLAVMDKKIMQEKIRHERRVELAFEGTRYFDLLRWKKMGDIIPNLIDPNGITRVWSEHNYLWPLPTSPLNQNPKLVQNPGYGKL
ncbi:MAG: RagB/SusD family nutrient uptake outer membrane protein [Bacteroidaceae bacterium]